ncbi:acyl-CoA thioesterase-1 [Ancylobacter sp. 3268]|uniref:arylesterase n=1 Tax=Ancylobacter sp. 3268 TaxID=2817752 RepID=UPI00285B6C95|nr:arylesterase [Ancylobacter sp. 3268]MDR6954959.1 acyl-CoA thioesterase-1 [Ancylobacter sp. 3268]
MRIKLFPACRRTLLILLAVLLPSLAVQAEPIRIVALGDSLTAGLGLSRDEAFPARLQAALRARGYDVVIVNGGVSGDTASAGAARLDRSVPRGTHGVILELGANDALSGIDPAVTEAALDDILSRLRRRGIPVLLAGMLAPPSRGLVYMSRFQAIFPRLAREHGVAFYRFFLAGVAGVPALNLPDGMHPNAAGVDVIVARLLPTAEAWLATIAAGR